MSRRPTLNTSINSVYCFGSCASSCHHTGASLSLKSWEMDWSVPISEMGSPVPLYPFCPVMNMD